MVRHPWDTMVIILLFTKLIEVLAIKLELWIAYSRLCGGGIVRWPRGTVQPPLADEEPPRLSAEEPPRLSAIELHLGCSHLFLILYSML